MDKIMALLDEAYDLMEERLELTGDDAYRAELDKLTNILVGLRIDLHKAEDDRKDRLAEQAEVGQGN